MKTIPKILTLFILVIILSLRIASTYVSQHTVRLEPQTTEVIVEIEATTTKVTPQIHHLPNTKSVFNTELNREVSIDEFNEMDVEALKSFSGIGDVTATAILNHIRASGPFTHFEQLIDIKGIGEKKLAKILGKLP